MKRNGPPRLSEGRIGLGKTIAEKFDWFVQTGHSNGVPAMASHLSMEERKRLSTLLEAGFSRAAVSRALGRAKSTITRELARNRRGWWYCPRQAQKRAERRRRQRPVKRKMDCPEIAAQVK